MNSDGLRKKGNELYNQIRDGEGRLATPILRMRLANAQNLYSDAARNASAPDQRASAFKNSACLFFLWAKIELRLYLDPDKSKLDSNLCMGTDPLQPIKHELATSIDFFLKARIEGVASAKPLEWLHELDRKFTELVKWASTKDPSRDFAFLRAVCKSLDDGKTPSEVSCVANMELADCLFKRGMLYFNSSEEYHAKDYKACLRYMNECLCALKRAESIFCLCQDIAMTDHSKGIRDMQDESQRHTKMCESLQAIEQGDEMMKQAIYEDVSLNMDLSLLAVDKYKQAISLCQEAVMEPKGKDVEIEAIAMSKIGKAYTTVLNMPTKGLKYHSQATTLVRSIMSPRIARSDWYKYSWDKTKQYEETKHLELAKQREEAINEIMLKLAGKIEELKNKCDELSAKSFLEFIYRGYPHPNPERSLGSMNDEVETKEAMRKAIIHYHPDNNVRQDLEWVILCSQITAFMNNKYETLN